MLPVKPTATAGTTKISTPAPKAAPKAAPEKQQPVALPGAAEIAARNNPLPKSSPEDAVKPETMTSAPAEKEKSIAAATAAATTAVKAEDKKYDHLSAPASAVASGTATPAEKEKENKEAEKKEIKKEESSGDESSPAASIGKSRYEHLSVPASAMHSSTPSPVESEMEMENAFKETPTKEEAEKVFPDIASVAAGVQDLQLGEGKAVQKQEAKEAEDAVKSVED